MRIILIVLGICLTSLSCKSKKESAEFFNRGNFHFKKKEYDRAEHFFSEAIRKNPKLADAYNNRGLIYLQRGEWERAGADFEAAVRLDRSFTEASLNLARYYTESGRADDAQVLLQDLETSLDTSSAFHNAYGQNYVVLNRFPEGEKHFRQALVLDTSHVEALTNLAYVMTVTHRYQEAAVLLRKALAREPDFVFALNNLAVLHGLQREWDRALPALVRAEQAEPNNIFVLNNLTLFYLESGQVDAGRTKLEQTEKRNDGNAFTRRNRGILCLKEGKAGQALEIFTEIETTTPETDHIYYYLGQAHEALGNKAAACKSYEIGQKLKDPWAAGKCPK